VVASGLVAGTYQFGFRSTDNHGAQSQEDFVVVTVQAAAGDSRKTLVVVDLCSLEYGDQSSNQPETGAAAQLRNSLDASQYDVYIAAANGQNLEQGVSRLNSLLAGKKDSAKYNNYVYVCGQPINSLAGYNTGLSSNDQVEALRRQQAQIAASQGYKSIAVTCSACMNSYGTTGSSANIELRRNEDTNRTRGHWKDDYGNKGLVDLAADPHLGPYRPDFATNSASKDYFYSDGQHYTDFGYNYYGVSLLKPAVLAVAAGNTYGVVTPYVPPQPNQPYNGPVTINDSSGFLTHDANGRYTNTKAGGPGEYGAFGTAAVKIPGVGRYTMALSAADAHDAVLGFYALTTARNGFASYDYGVFNETSGSATRVDSFFGGANNFELGPTTNPAAGSTARLGLDRDANNLVTVIYKADGASDYTKIRPLGTYAGDLIPALDVSPTCAAYDLQGEGLLAI
jgi:hypothetical protein